MASIEQWANRLSKIRRGMDPDAESVNESSDFEGQQAKIDAIRRGGTSPDLKALLESRLSEVPSERAAYQADAVKSYAPGTVEEGIARTIPQDNSAAAKLARAIQMLRGAVYGEAPEQQESAGKGVTRTYPPGRLGSVQRVLGGVSDMMYGKPGQDISARDITLLQEGDQENRGAANIMGNIARIGAKRRMAGKQLRESEEDRQANLELKRAQAAYQRSGVGYREGQLDIRREANEIARIRAEVYSAKSSADIDRLERQLKVNQQNSLTRMDEARTAARNARSTEERDAANEEYRQAKFVYDKAQDIIDTDIRQKQLEVSQGNLDVSRGNLSIAQQELPGKLTQQNAATNKAIRESIQIGPNAQALIDRARALKKERDRKAIMDRFRFGLIDSPEEAQKQLDALETQGNFSMPPITPPASPYSQPDIYEEPSTGITPAKSSKAGTVQLIGPGGEIKEGPADKADAWLKAHPGWRRK